MPNGQRNCHALFSQCVYRERYDTPRKLGNYCFMTDEDSQMSPHRLVSTPKLAALQTYFFRRLCSNCLIAQEKKSDGNVD